MKMEIIKSKQFGKFIHLSDLQNKVNVAKSANGSFYLYMDHLREPLQLKKGVRLLELFQIVQSEWLKQSERLH